MKAHNVDPTGLFRVPPVTERGFLTQETRRAFVWIHGIHHVGARSDGPDHNLRLGGDTANLGSLARL